MPDTIVTLGDFDFQEFEVPEQIPFGGEQALGVHKLIGGQKVVDAMGWFAEDIAFSGRFRGQNATARARYVQGLFRAGVQVTFTWDVFRYSVVCKTFHADFQRFYEVPYSLTLEVVSDLTAPIIVVPEISVDDQVASDMTEAQGFADAVGSGPLSSAISTLASAVSSAQTFVGAASSVLASVQTPIVAALSISSGLIASNTNILSSVSTFGGIVAGGNPATLATSLLNQTGAMETLSSLYGLNNVLTRMSVNLAADGASGAVLTQAAGNLWQIASKAYGDPSQWTVIARANGLTDPELSGINTLRIPATPDNSGGVWTN